MPRAPFRRLAGIAATILGAAFLLPVSGASAAPYTCDGKVATIVGTEGIDRINGTPGDDVIVGLHGKDVIHGRGGNDTICAYRDFTGADSIPGGTDLLFGEGGSDTLIGTDVYADIATGGPGDDSFVDIGVDYAEAAGPVTVDLQAGAGTGEGHDTYSGVRVLHGSRYADTLRGRDQLDETWCMPTCEYLYGGAGADVIDGGSGSDRLDGQKGDDRLEGGAGDDRFYPGPGADRVNGGSGSNTVFYVHSRRGVLIDLRGGRARGQGADRLTDVDSAFGSRFADTIHGNAADNDLHGMAGDDLVRGHRGDDRMIGNAGRDRLYAGTGDDQAYGGRGHDRCHAEYQLSC